MTETLPESSRLSDLSARVVMRDGSAVLAPLNIDANAVRLRGDGRLDLLSQDFRATFAAKITPELAELDPACEVNERYTNIDWPVACEGNLEGDPDEWCGVDTQKIIEELARNEAKRKIGKEAGRLLDKLFKD
jgi:AsmA protein